ncbi:hypothetical protein LTS18_005992 [Coniosporium uncinatum]|uniref:Uncharacterized protein n=1 Tax=Coniosporium uncinatum TaxID=93489 RepID=A0ACC3DCP1_9PEZI|nr:hypothetical protein LTS18_005992 [Coniosporium uncinatum]
MDPDIEGTRYHTTIFVETEPSSGKGVIHHVTGDITSANGMRYERKQRDRPEDSRTYHSKEFLGYTIASTYPQSWNTLLQNVPAPHQQKAFNVATMRTEPFKTLNPLTFYGSGEARPPLFKCTEWTEQRAIPALQSAGLIQQPSTHTATAAVTTSEPASNLSTTTGAANSRWVWDTTYRRYRYWDENKQDWIWDTTNR